MRDLKTQKWKTRDEARFGSVVRGGLSLLEYRPCRSDPRDSDESVGWEPSAVSPFSHSRVFHSV